MRLTNHRKDHDLLAEKKPLFYKTYITLKEVEVNLGYLRFIQNNDVDFEGNLFEDCIYL